jgi:hypothetical protein
MHGHMNVKYKVEINCSYAEVQIVEFDGFSTVHHGIE